MRPRWLRVKPTAANVLADFFPSVVDVGKAVKVESKLAQNRNDVRSGVNLFDGSNELADSGNDLLVAKVIQALPQERRKGRCRQVAPKFREGKGYQAE